MTSSVSVVRIPVSFATAVMRPELARYEPEDRLLCVHCYCKHKLQHPQICQCEVCESVPECCSLEEDGSISECDEESCSETECDDTRAVMVGVWSCVLMFINADL